MEEKTWVLQKHSASENLEAVKFVDSDVLLGHSI